MENNYTCTIRKHFTNWLLYHMILLTTLHFLALQNIIPTYTTLKYFAHFSRFLSQFTFEFSHSDFNTLIRSLDIYILTSYPSKTFDFSLLNFWFQPSFSGQLLELLSLIWKKKSRIIATFHHIIFAAIG